MERGRREDMESRAEGGEEEERTRRMEGRSDGKGAGRNTANKPSYAKPPLPASVRLHWSSAAVSQSIPQKVCVVHGLDPWMIPMDHNHKKKHANNRLPPQTRGGLPDWS